MKKINEIRDLLIEYGKKINAPQELLKVFIGPQPDGTPYITITSNEYYYTIEERGTIFQERKTKDIDLLLYWLINDIVFKISTEYDSDHIVKNQDGRRSMFEKELNLLRKIKKEWYEKRKQEIEKTLINAPYRDNN